MEHGSHHGAGIKERETKKIFKNTYRGKLPENLLLDDGTVTPGEQARGSD